MSGRNWKRWRLWAIAGGLLVAGAGPPDLAMTDGWSGREGPPAGPDPGLLTGTWRATDGTEAIIARTATRAVWHVPSTGAIRLLAPDGPLGYRAGPGLLLDEPPELRVRPASPERWRAGELPERLVVTTGDGPEIQMTRERPYRVDEVAFPGGGGTHLAGNLFLPESPGPHPGVVVVHGSGPQDRYGSLGYYDLVARRFAAAGFAVLTFDKRGTGDSSGDWRSAGFDVLAADVVAAAGALADREDVDDAAVGLWGISQAGWVAARAVELRPGTPFVVLVSAAGTALTPAEQNSFNVRTELGAAGTAPRLVEAAVEAWERLYAHVEGRGESIVLDSLVRTLRAAELPGDLLPPRPGEIEDGGGAWFQTLDIGFDPRPVWTNYPGRVLAVLGGRDTSTPTERVIDRVERLPARARERWSLTAHAGADHFLLESPSGSIRDLATRRRFADGAFEGMVAWALRTLEGW